MRAAAQRNEMSIGRVDGLLLESYVSRNSCPPTVCGSAGDLGYSVNRNSSVARAQTDPFLLGSVLAGRTLEIASSKKGRLDQLAEGEDNFTTSNSNRSTNTLFMETSIQ